MIYKVGEPAFLLKKSLSNYCSISCPSLLTGFTIVILLSFGCCKSPIHFLFFYALFHFMVGQSSTIVSNTPAYSDSSKSNTNSVLPHAV